MPFIADDLGAWLVGLLADAGHRRLLTLVLGDEQERALHQACRAALAATAAELWPDDAAAADEAAMVVGEVFGTPVRQLAGGHGTLLEALRAGIGAQMAVLDDRGITTEPGWSSADALGVSAAEVTQDLAAHLVREITTRGARGGPLESLANQLGHDRSFLQGLRLEGKIDHLDATLVTMLAVLDQARPAPAQADRPQAKAARPFLLLETGRVVGRGDLRADIERFLSKPGEGASVLVLFGVGGTGKSALAWDTWKRLRHIGAPRRQFWYSFYDGRGSGSFRGLLTELAGFLGVPARYDTSVVAVEDVLDALTGDDIVLFLDGIERCLRCYQRPLAVGDLDAVRVQEDSATSWGSHELGFAGEEAARFFLQLSELATCRVVATSRIVPSEYFTSGGGLRAGVAAQLVGGLSAAEAAELLTATGLRLDLAVAGGVAESLGGHPLALQLLARQARNAMRAGRDVTAWLVEEGYLYAGGSGSAAIRNQLFTRAAAFLSADAGMALAATGALGGSLDLPTLRHIISAEPVGDERLAAVAMEITTSGLGLQTDDGRLACHPLMASAAIDHLSPDQTRQLVTAISGTLEQRFEAIPQSYGDWFHRGRQLSDRAEAMALCQALIRLQYWREAAVLYDDQLRLPLKFGFGANFEAAQLLQALAEGWSSQPEGHVRTQVLDGMHALLAHHLLMTGQIRRAEAVLGELSAAGAQRAEAVQTAARVALHLGHHERALRLATDALHGARSRYEVASIILDEVISLWFQPHVPTDEAVADFVEAALLCSRILRVGSPPAEAAMLLREAENLRWQEHSHCQPCRGALLRGAAELLLPSAPSLALAALRMGKDLQEQGGRILEGLESDVLVTAAVTLRAASANGATQVGDMRIPEPDQPPGGWEDLPGFLSDAGFVLYQLFLEGASGVVTGGPGAQEPSRALSELDALGAGFLLSQLSRTPPDPASRLPDPVVARCVGWLIERQPQDAQPGHRGADLGPEQQQVIDDVDHALCTMAAAEYPADIRRELATPLQDTGLTTVPAQTSAIWDMLPSAHRRRAQHCLDAGNAEGYKAALTLAVETDPCDTQSLAQLASLAAREGDRDAPDAYTGKPLWLYWLLRLIFGRNVRVRRH